MNGFYCTENLHYLLRYNKSVQRPASTTCPQSRKEASEVPRAACPSSFLRLRAVCVCCPPFGSSSFCLSRERLNPSSSEGKEKKKEKPSTSPLSERGTKWKTDHSWSRGMRSVLFQRLAQGGHGSSRWDQFDPGPHFLQDTVEQTDLALFLKREAVPQNCQRACTECSVGSRPVTNNSVIFCEQERGGEGGIVFHANSTVINLAL